MSKYMTQEIFDMCAVTAAKVGSGTEKSIEKAADLIAQNYTSTYADTNLAQDIALAAHKAIKFMEDSLPQGSMVANCTQLQFCIKEYNPDGKKKRKKLLGGTLFNYEKRPIPDKVKGCITNLLAYHLYILNGNIPMAPENWRLG
jgi:hypothetical protein